MANNFKHIMGLYFFKIEWIVSRNYVKNIPLVVLIFFIELIISFNRNNMLNNPCKEQR